MNYTWNLWINYDFSLFSSSSSAAVVGCAAGGTGAAAGGSFIADAELAVDHLADAVNGAYDCAAQNGLMAENGEDINEVIPEKAIKNHEKKPVFLTKLL